MTRRALAILAIVLGIARPVAAHVGSPDVFYEGDAGPYHLFVTVRMPQVIPGVATIEVRAADADVAAITVVPLRLTGPGSELPPTPDRADRSHDDPQLFTASLWLMEHGALQVRIAVDGPRGSGVLAVPLAAAARATLGMSTGLGVVLFALLLVLGLSLASIAGAAVREAALPPGVVPPAPLRRRARIATVLAGAVVVGVLAFGNAWWSSEARGYADFIARPWILQPVVAGCTLTLPRLGTSVLPDHGHDLHLFVVRAPDLDRLGHLHPVQQADGSFVQALPSLPAGHYALFADIVTPTGFPITGTAELDLPALTCPPLAGDDAALLGPGAASIVFDRPAAFHASVAEPLRFHVIAADGSPATDVEPYMGMAGHAVVIRADLSVFAHLHPSGSVPMPALMLAHTPHAMFADGAPLAPQLRFPYAFPQPGRYRVFVQIKRAGQIETGAFDVDVAP